MMAILFLFLLILYMLFWTINIDGADTQHVAVLAKRAVSRAVKAGTMPLDEDELALGNIHLDEVLARDYFDSMLRANLFLQADNTPLSSSPLSEAPDILHFYVYNGDSGYPYNYVWNTTDGENGQSINITHEFKDPGVLALVKVKRKENFGGRARIIYAFSAAEIKR